MDFVVHVNGSPAQRCWEISLLRPSFEHGAKSWGWFGEDKLPVATVESWSLRGLTQAQIEAVYNGGIEGAKAALSALTHAHSGEPG